MPRPQKGSAKNKSSIDLGAIFGAIYGAQEPTANPDFGKDPGDVNPNFRGDPSMPFAKPSWGQRVFAPERAGLTTAANMQSVLDAERMRQNFANTKELGAIDFANKKALYDHEAKAKLDAQSQEDSLRMSNYGKGARAFGKGSIDGQPQSLLYSDEMLGRALLTGFGDRIKQTGTATAPSLVGADIAGNKAKESQSVLDRTISGAQNKWASTPMGEMGIINEFGERSRKTGIDNDASILKNDLLRATNPYAGPRAEVEIERLRQDRDKNDAEKPYWQQNAKSNSVRNQYLQFGNDSYYNPDEGRFIYSNANSILGNQFNVTPRISDTTPKKPIRITNPNVSSPTQASPIEVAPMAQPRATSPVQQQSSDPMNMDAYSMSVINNPSMSPDMKQRILQEYFQKKQSEAARSFWSERGY